MQILEMWLLKLVIQAQKSAVAFIKDVSQGLGGALCGIWGHDIHSLLREHSCSWRDTEYLYFKEMDELCNFTFQ